MLRTNCENIYHTLKFKLEYERIELNIADFDYFFLLD